MGGEEGGGAARSFPPGDHLSLLWRPQGTNIEYTRNSIPRVQNKGNRQSAAAVAQSQYASMAEYYNRDDSIGGKNRFFLVAGRIFKCKKIRF